MFYLLSYSVFILSKISLLDIVTDESSEKFEFITLYNSLKNVFNLFFNQRSSFDENSLVKPLSLSSRTGNLRVVEKNELKLDKNLRF